MEYFLINKRSISQKKFKDFLNDLDKQNIGNKICLFLDKVIDPFIYLLNFSHAFLYSESYLFITIKSAISIIPFLIPYKLSPLPGGIT